MCPAPNCGRMLTDSSTALACPFHMIRVSLFTKDRLAEGWRTGNADLYLAAERQAFREMSTDPVSRWVESGARSW